MSGERLGAISRHILGGRVAGRWGILYMHVVKTPCSTHDTHTARVPYCINIPPKVLFFLSILVRRLPWLVESVPRIKTVAWRKLMQYITKHTRKSTYSKSITPTPPPTHTPPSCPVKESRNGAAEERQAKYIHTNATRTQTGIRLTLSPGSVSPYRQAHDVNSFRNAAREVMDSKPESFVWRSKRRRNSFNAGESDRI